MLTRLEIDGFKNLLDFSANFGPYTCIAGDNGVGKSNVFDAVQFLSLLADHTFLDAAQAVRPSSDGRGFATRDLFWRGGRQRRDDMTLTAEMLIPDEVTDDFGRSVAPTATYLRYSVRIGLSQSTGRMSLQAESLHRLGSASERLRPGFPMTEAFADAAVRLGGGPGTFLSTDSFGVRLLPDTGREERVVPLGPSAARTVLSTVSLADRPTVLAARRELQSWRRLALDPAALRNPDSYFAPSSIGPDGSHLASVLHRLAGEQGTEEGAEAFFARMTSLLDRLSGLRFQSMRVDQDEARQLLSIELVDRSGTVVPARSLSEGTLRFLAMCALLEDSETHGLVCLEEPENGIHPANVPAVLEVIRRLAVDAEMPPAHDNPLRQVLINTHSPVVIQSTRRDDLLIAAPRRIRLPDSESALVLSLLPVVGSWRADSELPGAAVTGADVLPYLTATPDAAFNLSA